MIFVLYLLIRLNCIIQKLQISTVTLKLLKLLIYIRVLASTFLLQITDDCRICFDNNDLKFYNFVLSLLRDYSPSLGTEGFFFFNSIDFLVEQVIELLTYTFTQSCPCVGLHPWKLIKRER